MTLPKLTPVLSATSLNFFRDTLKIVNPSDTIKIERAHRIGRYDSSKKRPIVGMFNHFPDKQLIKNKFRDVDNQSSSSDPSSIRYSEQFPPVIQEHRQKLIPAMIKAKQEGRTAYLSYDILFINGTMYNVNNINTSGYN